MKRNFNEDYILARNIKNNWDGRLAIYGQTPIHCIDALPWVFTPYIGKGLSSGIIADVLEVPKQSVQRTFKQRNEKLSKMKQCELGRLNTDLRKLLAMNNPPGGDNRWGKAPMKRAILLTKIKQDLHKALAEMHELRKKEPQQNRSERIKSEHKPGPAPKGSIAAGTHKPAGYLVADETHKHPKTNDNA